MEACDDFRSFTSLLRRFLAFFILTSSSCNLLFSSASRDLCSSLSFSLLFWTSYDFSKFCTRAFSCFAWSAGVIADCFRDEEFCSDAYWLSYWAFVLLEISLTLLMRFRSTWFSFF